MKLVLSHLPAALTQIIGELSYACLERLISQLQAVWGVFYMFAVSWPELRLPRMPGRLWTAVDRPPAIFLVAQKHPPVKNQSQKNTPPSFFRIEKITP